MKIEILKPFYGRPDDAADELTMFLEGAAVEVPDVFGQMVIDKGLAKLANAKPAKKDPPHEIE